VLMSVSALLLSLRNISRRVPLHLKHRKHEELGARKRPKELTLSLSHSTARTDELALFTALNSSIPNISPRGTLTGDFINGRSLRRRVRSESVLIALSGPSSDVRWRRGSRLSVELETMHVAKE
jgi:hypothetical protein